MAEKKSWAAMSNTEWREMFEKAETCDEVFRVMDEGYDSEEWAQKVPLWMKETLPEQAEEI